MCLPRRGQIGTSCSERGGSARVRTIYAAESGVACALNNWTRGAHRIPGRLGPWGDSQESPCAQVQPKIDHPPGHEGEDEDPDAGSDEEGRGRRGGGGVDVLV